MRKIILATLVSGLLTLTSLAQQACSLTAAVSPLNYRATQGETVVFTADIVGVGPFNVYWANEKGVVLSGLVGDNRTIAISNVNASDAGLIYLVVYDLSTGCGTVTAARLSVASGVRGQGRQHDGKE